LIGRSRAPLDAAILKALAKNPPTGMGGRQRFRCRAGAEGSSGPPSLTGVCSRSAAVLALAVAVVWRPPQPAAAPASVSVTKVSVEEAPPPLPPSRLAEAAAVPEVRALPDDPSRIGPTSRTASGVACGLSTAGAAYSRQPTARRPCPQPSSTATTPQRRHRPGSSP
jgi:hypothetical protein